MMTLPPFEHLNVAERIELAERLWESLELRDIKTSDAHRAVLTERRVALQADGDAGTDWQAAISDIEGHVA